MLLAVLLGLSLHAALEPSALTPQLVPARVESRLGLLLWQTLHSGNRGFKQALTTSKKQDHRPMSDCYSHLGELPAQGLRAALLFYQQLQAMGGGLGKLPERHAEPTGFQVSALRLSQREEKPHPRNPDSPGLDAYRISILWFFAVLLLLSAYLINNWANRRQLNLERRIKSDLEDLVSIRTSELESRCDELETLEGLIKTINRETELPRVLQAILDQALLLFPKADHGAFLLWSAERERFEVVATTGYNNNALAHVYFNHEEMLARYSAGNTLFPGIVLIDDIEYLPGKDKLEGMAVPTSLVATEVRLHNEVQGFFILESYASDRFFKTEDSHRLIRLREHIVSALGKAQNLSELKRFNRQILETQDKLVTQQKIASLGILSAGIAHEMKNPLNFVNTLSDLNQELVQDLRIAIQAYASEASEEHLQEVMAVLLAFEQNSQLINKHGNRANQIVQMMMEMAHGGNVEKRPVKLNPLINEFVMLAYKAMTAKDLAFTVRLSLDLSEQVGTVTVAAQNISRVVINIVNNAFESVVSKKKKANGDYTPTILVSSELCGDNVVLRIRDNGTGIPAQDKAHIWEHFFSTKPSSEGNIGLGLAICYDIVVNEHGGSIQVESEEGEYAEFIITLPRHTARLNEKPAV